MRRRGSSPSVPSSTSEAEAVMQHLRIISPTHLTDEVVEVFTGDPAVSHLAVLRGASLEPAGDIVLADVAREATNEIIDRLARSASPRAAPSTSSRSPPGSPVPGSTPSARRPARRRRRGLGRRHPTRLRGVRAQLDLPGVHDARHPARAHRHRPGLPDPRHRRHGARARVRRHRRPGPRAGASPGHPVRARGSHPVARFRCRDRPHHHRRAGSPGPRVDRHRGRHRATGPAPPSSTPPTSGPSSSPSSRRPPASSH